MIRYDSMNITIYIRKELEEAFKAEPDKSKLINRLLEQHYDSVSAKNAIHIPNVAKVHKVKAKTEDVWQIPGIEKASEAKCKGTHYMNRKDCGKLDCPWKGIK